MRVKLQPSAVRLTTPMVGSRTIPTYGEDKDAAVSAFHKAFSESQPEATRIPGLQAFAGAVCFLLLNG